MPGPCSSPNGDKANTLRPFDKRTPSGKTAKQRAKGKARKA